MPDVDGGQISDIARYISATSALKELHLGIWLPETFAEGAKIGWAVILESLRQNASVNEPHVIAVSMTAPQIELLADALYCKRNVHRLHEWFAIRDVTRRNSDFFARAALFVNGTVVDRYRTEALELVAEEPSLWDELAQQLSVSDAEAAALVRTALRSIHSIDDFMRVAGVVKQRVTCESREDGRMQLDDLNEDCWTLVRRLLRVEDYVMTADSMLALMYADIL
ncbi:hypothetical protein HPB50_012558 [Hyalomma asiaticum]|uniref:Uncharacterized protein n=1 Tax=Hyalomma asiaticum TaxID=266040 RepID=A0ACB7TJH6_HYAAI|nr:hypothetical protein HPB50_012558 [Hyalomma asiaticum]